MHLKSLNLVNFKNYDSAELHFSADINCLVGDNGSGKTNILDAIHYLSLCKSYYNPIDSQNIRHDEGFFLVEGAMSIDSGKEDFLYCGVKRGQKKVFKRNQVEYDRLADHIGRYPAVMITPSDVDIINEGSEVRRKFIDSIISQFDRDYLDTLIKYNKALTQRNNLLKYFALNRTFDAESLSVWDHQLIRLGKLIYEARKSFISAFAEGFSRYYADICGGVEEVEIVYSSDLHELDGESLVAVSLDKDRRFQRTSAGVHKDDLALLINGHPVKKFGSQGQQKSFLIALKLGQFQFLKEARGVLPILLLDDIFDKIDDKRVAFLMGLVSQHEFGQIFITDTHGRRVPELFSGMDVELYTFNVENGNVVQEILS